MSLTKILIALVVVYILYRIFYMKEYYTNETPTIIGSTVGTVLAVIAGVVLFFWFKNRNVSSKATDIFPSAASVFTDNADDW